MLNAYALCPLRAPIAAVRSNVCGPEKLPFRLGICFRVGLVERGERSGFGS